MKKEKLNLSALMRSSHGFSLVEIIVAMAVLMIVIIAFTTLFTFAFGGIFSQGRKSEALYKDVQKELEVLYEQGDLGDSDTLDIDFGGSGIDPSVSGVIVTETFTYEDRSGNIYTFIPNSQ